MKKYFLIAASFTLGIGGALLSSNTNAHTLLQSAWSKQGGSCVQGEIDNTTENCAIQTGTACTISLQQAYGNMEDCEEGTNPLNFQ